MKCGKCGRSIDDVVLYRNNPKGEKADWRCEDCLNVDYKPEKELKKLCDIIKNGDKL